MKLSIGLSLKEFTDDNLSFARQAGADSIVVHLTDYKGINLSMEGFDFSENKVFTNTNLQLWEPEYLQNMQDKANKHDLVIAGIENFDPGSWYDILLDGPEKEIQIETVIQCIKNASEANINTIHYNFSIAGIWGWYKDTVARGGAKSVVFDMDKVKLDKPIPDGMVWNMYYKEPTGSWVEPVSEQQIWGRVKYFLDKVLPVAESYGVSLAAHPDDPPVEKLRRTSRLINSPEKYYRLLNLHESKSNAINFCLGTTQEMPQCNIYELLDNLLEKNAVKIIHFRNVRGKIPRYFEVFPDEGDIDMKAVISILKKHSYNGILMPDHTPEMTCKAPWHSGIAYTMGYIKGLLQ